MPSGRRLARDAEGSAVDGAGLLLLVSNQGDDPTGGGGEDRVL